MMQQKIMESEIRKIMKTSVNTSGWLDWAYKGVDFDLAGNGGLECRDFITIRQRIIESLVGSIAAGIIICRAFSKLTLPKDPGPLYKPDPIGKRILLVVHCLIFGIELGYKFATKQMIYILNPCHLATMMQIFCLAAPSGRITTSVFRLHLHMLTGAPMAILFPVTNTRLLPFEPQVYYIQHILMLVIPFYLLKLGGTFTAEPILDFSWASMSLGMLYIYHFLPLQYLAYESLVNLNNMLCPAVSDPFYGWAYRICAMTHQGILIPTLGKFYTWLSKKIGLRTNPMNAEEVSIFQLNWENRTQSPTTMNGKNGVIHHQTSVQQPTNGHIKSS